MTKLLLLFLVPLTGHLARCSKASSLAHVSKRDFETSTSSKIKPPENEALVEIQTEYGTIRCRLYNETHKHRDNFLKLVNENYFNNTLFHRVIKNFVIQGGDPDSRQATKGQKLGEGGPGYNIAPEFFPEKYFHKKGALAAARESDDINPKKESSGSQFYIVQGKIHDEASILKNEIRINRSVFQKISDSLLSLPENFNLKQSWINAKTKNGSKDSLAYFQKKIDEMTEPIYVKASKYKIPEWQKSIYMKIGGAPHLDTHYTVFGEIYEGIEVLDKIISANTDNNDRPLSDIRMQIKIIRSYK